MSREFEEYIVEVLDSLASWKVPFDGYTVHCLVKSYLDAEKKNIWPFKNIFPGSDWLQSFIKT